MAVLNSTALNTQPYNGKKYIASTTVASGYYGGYNGTTHNRITYNQVQPTAPVIPVPTVRYTGGYNSITHNRATHNQVLSYLTTTLAPTFNRFAYNSALVYLTVVTTSIIDGGYNASEYLGVAYNDVQDPASGFSLQPVAIVGTAIVTAGINRIHMSVPTSYITIIQPEDSNIVMYV